MSKEIEYINIIKGLLNSDSPLVFKPSKDWMIIHKTGIVPDFTLDPKRILKGREISIRPEIRGMPVVVLLRKEAAKLFNDFSDSRSNRIHFHNLREPAIKISFFKEHRYKASGKMTKEEALLYLNKMSVSSDGHEDLDIAKEVVTSSSKKFFYCNYDHDYEYFTVALKCINKSTDLQHSFTNHISKGKLNVIFLEDDLIDKGMPKRARYSSKVIDLLIASSNKVYDGPINHLYEVEDAIYDSYLRKDDSDNN